MTNTRRRKVKNYVEFYTFNISAIPANHDNTDFYSNLFEKFYKYEKEIEYGKDFYYKMTRLDKLKSDNTDYYYGNIARYLNLNNIDWEKREKEADGNEPEAPADLAGRKSTYEFVFFPNIHKLVFIKKGKIDQEVKRKGAPIKVIQNVLKIGLEQVMIEDKTLYVDVIQSEEVIERIFNTTILQLDMNLHYTNPDLEDEYGEFVDELYRETNSGNIISEHHGTKEQPINTESKLIKGSLNIARKNGSAKARAIDEQGKSIIINTQKHPEIKEIEAKEYKENLFYETLKKIKHVFIRD